ncbi:helix-turn-helix transcriptional regulator, partial [Streptomyces sp. NPDC005349]|uniref:helix-turn-helix domain-containing protein n=1 Tax=Streptomyces sp. NPDC005349 TaxID=3157037 RepID=UPI0033A1FCE4
MSGEKPFGVVLRGLRQQARLTMGELAEASGVSVRAIGDMERGRSRVPQRRTVVALAEGLGLAETEREDLLAAGAEPAYEDPAARGSLADAATLRVRRVARAADA